MALITSVPPTGQSFNGIYEWTPTVDTNALAAGDIAAVTEELNEFFIRPGGGAYIIGLTLISKTDTAPELDFYLFETNVSLGTLNLVPSITDANALKLVQKINVATTAWEDLGGCQVASLSTSDFGVRYLQAASGSRDVFGAIVTGTAMTFGSASDLVVKLALEFR